MQKNCTPLLKGQSPDRRKSVLAILTLTIVACCFVSRLVLWPSYIQHNVVLLQGMPRQRHEVFSPHEAKSSGKGLGNTLGVIEGMNGLRQVPVFQLGTQYEQNHFPVQHIKPKASRANLYAPHAQNAFRRPSATIHKPFEQATLPRSLSVEEMGSAIKKSVSIPNRIVRTRALDREVPKPTSEGQEVDPFDLSSLQNEIFGSAAQAKKKQSHLPGVNLWGFQSPPGLAQEAKKNSRDLVRAFHQRRRGEAGLLRAGVWTGDEAAAFAAPARTQLLADAAPAAPAAPAPAAQGPPAPAAPAPAGNASAPDWSYFAGTPLDLAGEADDDPWEMGRSNSSDPALLDGPPLLRTPACRHTRSRRWWARCPAGRAAWRRCRAAGPSSAEWAAEGCAKGLAEEEDAAAAFSREWWEGPAGRAAWAVCRRAGWGSREWNENQCWRRPQSVAAKSGVAWDRLPVDAVASSRPSPANSFVAAPAPPARKGLAGRTDQEVGDYVGTGPWARAGDDFWEHERDFPQRPCAGACRDGLYAPALYDPAGRRPDLFPPPPA